VTVFNVLEMRVGRGRLVGFGVCLVVLFAFQLAHSGLRPERWPRYVRILSLSGQALLTYLPLLLIGMPWGSMAGFLAGSLLLIISGPLRWVLYAATAAAMVPPILLWKMGPLGAGYGVSVTLVTGLVVFGVSSLSGLVTELHAARSELARMAVTKERLRVARDIHDLLGYSLSSINLKSELAYRLLPTAADRARNEVADVLGISRQALADIRLVASGYRNMSLATEIDSATSVLDSAKITVHTDLTTTPLPQAIDTVLAIVVREAITNILRHSKAEHCTITTTQKNGTVTLHITNDGAEPPTDPPTDHSGSGLTNLADRLTTIGGTLTTHTTPDGHFHVTAQAPGLQQLISAGSET
ncbi:MAG: hypothetical protein J2P17_28680, partial [Mycobacterium sp.]|nr:hypothetical protein [Mycobacterium sp.]